MTADCPPQHGRQQHAPPTMTTLIRPAKPIPQLQPDQRPARPGGASLGSSEL